MFILLYIMYILLNIMHKTIHGVHFVQHHVDFVKHNVHSRSGAGGAPHDLPPAPAPQARQPLQRQHNEHGVEQTDHDVQ